MNKERRASLNKAIGLLQEAKDIVAQCRDEEQEFYDNMPENMQSGEKGEKATATADTLSEVDDLLDDAVGKIEEAAE